MASRRAHRLDLFRLLNGLITIWKPPNFGLDRMLVMFRKKMAEEFNSLPSEPRLLRTLLQSGTEDSNKLTVTSVPDIVDSRLVLGRAFMPGDFVMYPIDPLSDLTSGIQVVGIGEDGVYGHAAAFEKSLYLKTYHLTGMLGRASTDGTATSSTLLRASWRHVKRSRIDRVLSGLCTQFKASTLLQAGLRPNTLAAYSALANRSSVCDLRPVAAEPSPCALDDQDQLISPWERNSPEDQVVIEQARNTEDKRRQKAPYVNSLRCIDFDPPFFTVELQVAHESPQFLVDLIANLGPKLRSATVLSRARRVRHGPITVEDSLLLKQCTVPEYLLDNFSQCISENEDAPSNIERADLLGAICGLPIDRTRLNLFSNMYICSKAFPFDCRSLDKSRDRFLTPLENKVT